MHPSSRSLASALLALAIASFATPADAQDVYVSADFGSVMFQDLDSLEVRGLVPSPTTQLVDVVHSGGGIFYGIRGFSSDSIPDVIVRTDARSGVQTLVGDTGLEWARKGIAFDPTSNTLYVLADTVSTSNSPTLYRIDVATGAATPVATAQTFFAHTLTIDANGRGLLVGVTGVPFVVGYPTVWELDLATGQITLLATFTSMPLPSNVTSDDAAVCSDGSILAQFSDQRLYRLHLPGANAAMVASWVVRRGMAIAPAAALGLAYVEGCSSPAPSLCPCGLNNASFPGHGCANSASQHGAKLRAYGVASLANDTLSLVTTEATSSSGICFQGTQQVAPFAFGDGLRCTGGTLRRLGGGPLSGGMLTYPSGTQLSISAQGQIGAPGTRVYQTFFRDNQSYCTSATFNLSNSVAVTWGP